MGCRESKIKRINLSPGDNRVDPMVSLNAGRLQNGRAGSAELFHQEFRMEDDMLPNRLLAAIPISDLGDSLDSRHLGESLNQSLGKTAFDGINNNNGSADSTDSGYDDYDEEYAHIITESSSPDKVRQVEAAFRHVDLPELLVITGRACARILSGYQKGKMEEARILDSLRKEGLLAMPRAKTAGGLSFEVVEESKGEIGAEPVLASQMIPRKKLERLELRRVNLRKPSAHIDTRLAEADERRKAVEDEKVKQVLERSGLERHGRMRSASALRREGAYSATVAKRTLYLEEMREKLKEKHRKSDMLRLKHQLMDDNGGGVESGYSRVNDGFFDD